MMVAFGLEPGYWPSFTFVCFYISLPFAFFVYWLTQYENDLQNASVPLLLIIALLTFLMLLFGKPLGFEQQE
jgi:hypothetical protein